MLRAKQWWIPKPVSLRAHSAWAPGSWGRGRRAGVLPVRPVFPRLGVRVRQHGSLQTLGQLLGSPAPRRSWAPRPPPPGPRTHEFTHSTTMFFHRFRVPTTFTMQTFLGLRDSSFSSSAGNGW